MDSRFKFCDPDGEARRLVLVGVAVVPGHEPDRRSCGPAAAMCHVLPERGEDEMSKHLAGNPARIQFLTRAELRSRRRLRHLAAPAALVLAGALLVLSPAAPAQAACANPIVCENQQPGYAAIHLGRKQPQHDHPRLRRPVQRQHREFDQLQDKSPATSYAIDIYRMGYYGGDGARRSPALPRTSRCRRTSRPATPTR